MPFVNISLARGKPGEYLEAVSQAVHDALGDECRDAVSLGDVPVRGYDKPVPVWRLA